MKHLTTLSLLLTFCWQFLFAQNFTLNLPQNTSEKSNFLRFDGDNNNENYTFSNVNDILEQKLNTRRGIDEFQLLFENDMGDGVVVRRYQQYFRGIKVEHGSVVFTAKNGKVIAVANNLVRLPENQSTTTSIAENKALEMAMTHIGADIYMWQDANAERELQTMNNDRNATYFPKAEKVFVHDFSGDERGQVSIAYKFNIYAKRPISRNFVFVDATSGNVLLKDPIIKHTGKDAHKMDFFDKVRASLVRILVDVKISIEEASARVAAPSNSSPTMYSSNQILETELSGTTYRMRSNLTENTLTGRIETYNSGNTTTYPITDFTDADNTWPVNAANDAHWGAEKTFRFWANRHNRRSYDNAGATIKSWVHFDVNYDNAFWNGTQMTYGDGSTFGELVSIDVCAHEIGHAVCTNTANLTYQGESGALNEGFSDIWGAAVENWVMPADEASGGTAKNPWLIGEEIGGTPVSSYGPLRNMQNPNAESQPDTYNGTMWASTSGTTSATDYGGVHTNSGVLNYEYYLLTVGGSGTNDIGNAFAVTGIGFLKSEKIAYLAEQNLSASSNFAAARTAFINAAISLYGNCSPEHESTVRSWYAVGVGANWVPCTPQVAFTTASGSVTETSAGSCMSSKTYDVTVNLAANASGTVTVTLGAPTGTATQGTNNDYTVSPSSVTFAGGTAGNRTFTITVYNDAYVESAETVILGYTVSGGGATVGTPSSFTLTITDDDLPPATAGGSTSTVTLIDDNFAGGTVPKTWCTYDFDNGVAPAGPGENGWGLYTDGTTGDKWYETWDVNAQNNNDGCPNTRTSTNGSAAYKNTSTSMSMVYTTVSTTNITGMTLSFSYMCGGEVSGGTTYDYGALLYSTDGATFNQVPGSAIFVNQTSVTTYTFALPAALENVATLYLAWYWENDESVGTTGFALDDILLTGTQSTTAPAPVETVLAASDTEYLGPNATVHFYNPSTGKVMATIENLSSHNYGCTTVAINNAGSGSVNSPSTAVEDLTSKHFLVTPTTNNVAGAYNITLYYTAAEINGWVGTNANGDPIGDLLMVKGPGAIGTQTVVQTAAATPSAFGSDWAYKAGFATGFSGFALGDAEPPLPVELLSFTATANRNSINLDWATASESNNKGFEIQRSTNSKDGFAKIGWVNGNGTTSVGKSYQFIDNTARKGLTYYYRLNQIDFDTKSELTKVVSARLFDKSFSAVIAPNPAKGKAFITLNRTAAQDVTLTLIDLQGKLLETRNIASSESRVELNLQNLAKGVYLVKLKSNEETIVEKLIVE